MDFGTWSPPHTLLLVITLIAFGCVESFLRQLSLCSRVMATHGWGV